jgi:hypothetical protein
LQKYLKLLSEPKIRLENMDCLSQAAKILEELIKKEKAKRMPAQTKEHAGEGPKSAIKISIIEDDDSEDDEPVMHIHNIKTSILLETALIRVSLTSVRRGKPDFNAHIYKMDSAQADDVRATIADYKKESDPKRVMQAMMRKKADSKGKAAATGDAGEAEEADEEDGSEDDDDDDEVLTCLLRLT